MLVTSDTLCQLFDVRSPGTLTKWKAAGAPGYVNRNEWDLKPFLRWWLDNIHEGTQAQDGDGTGTLAVAKLDYWRAKADGERLDVDKKRGALVTRGDIAAEWKWRVAEISSGLDMLALRLPPRLEGHNQAEMRRIIEEETDNLRRNYCREGRFCPQSQPQKPKREKKAPAKRGRKPGGGRKKRPLGSRKSVSQSPNGPKNT